MDIPTGLFVIATTGSLFGGILIGMSFLHFFGKLRSSGEEKRKKEEEYRQRIDEWKENLLKEGYELEPILAPGIHGKEPTGEYIVRKVHKFSGRIRDCYSKTVEGYHGDDIPAITVKLRTYKPEVGRDINLLIHTSIPKGIEEIKKLYFEGLMLFQKYGVKAGEKIAFDPIRDLDSEDVYTRLEYASLKESPGSKPILVYRKPPVGRVDRKLTEFK